MSDLDDYGREQDIIFEDLKRTATVETIVDRLTAVMRQMDERDPDAFAALARRWTFDFVRRQQGGTIEAASDLSKSVCKPDSRSLRRYAIRGLNFWYVRVQERGTPNGPPC